MESYLVQKFYFTLYVEICIASFFKHIYIFTNHALILIEFLKRKAFGKVLCLSTLYVKICGQLMKKVHSVERKKTIKK